MKWTVTKISDLPLQTCLVGSLTFFGLCAGPAASTWAADLIFMGGHIYTADTTAPTAEALVVDDDTIVFVGSKKEAMTYRKPSTRVIDTEGKMVMPGFHDAHLHTFMGGRSLLGCDLAEAPDLQAIETILSA